MQNNIYIVVHVLLSYIFLAMYVNGVMIILIKDLNYLYIFLKKIDYY